MSSLADVFEDGEPEPIDQPEPTEEVTEVEPVEAVEPEKVEKEVEPEATTAPEVPAEPQNVPIKALMAEREKRQALERQMAEFQAQKEAEPAPDIFEDQNKYTEHLQQKYQDDLFNMKANMSEELARQQYSDLDSKVETFKQIVQDNPALQTQVMSAALPYHELVNIVNKHEKMEKMQNIEEFEKTTRAEIEAQVRAELKAELEGKQQADKNLRESIPTSLVDAPSKGSVTKPAWSGTSSLSNLFGD